MRDAQEYRRRRAGRRREADPRRPADGERRRWRTRSSRSSSRCRSSRATRSPRSRTRRRRRCSCSSRFRRRLLHLVLPISIAIAAMLFIVALSYTQTVRAYETSGGAYVVAKDNLGTLPSLVAAAALLTDYILTVAVSVAAGIVAITSAAPSLHPYRVWLCARVHPRDHGREPARRARVRACCSRCPTYGFVLSLYRGDRDGRGEVRRRHVPAGARSASGRRRRGNGDAARPAACVRIWIGRADRRRIDLERRQRVQAAAVEERSADARDHGRDRDLALHRRVVARGADARAAERDGVGAVADRARVVPDRADVLRRPGLHARDPDPRGELLVPGLPAARRAARARPLLPAAVREPRRPARLLERDRPRRGARVGADRHLLGERRVAAAPLRRRRLHGVHAVADGDGALLAAHARPRLAAARGRERRRRVRDRARDADRDRDEVHPGRVGGDGRDPADGRRVLRDAAALPPRRPAAARGRERRRSGAARDEPGRPLRESIDAALREALWYARRIAGDGFRAIAAPGRAPIPACARGSAT